MLQEKRAVEDAIRLQEQVLPLPVRAPRRLLLMLMIIIIIIIIVMMVMVLMFLYCASFAPLTPLQSSLQSQKLKDLAEQKRKVALSFSQRIRALGAPDNE